MDPDAELLREFRHTLADDERARAARFHFELHRARFVAGRGLLRAILARYLGADPAALRFAYGARGKPALAPGNAAPAVRFNFANSDGRALCAVTLGREIGVDLERIRPESATDAVAEDFFSRAEVATLRALDAEHRTRAFFDCWTRKEAYIKARGDGLWLPLDRFEVSLAPGEPAALLATHDDPAEAARWSLRELHPGPGYAAALAVEGRGWRLRCWQWPGG